MKIFFVTIVIFICLSCVSFKNKECKCYTHEVSDKSCKIYPGEDYLFDGSWYINVSGDTLDYRDFLKK